VLLACTALVAPGFALAQAPALPQGGQFVAGQGSIGAATGNALTITQTSARGIIDWRSFNIGQGASVTVQNGAGATLNRVTGGDLSQILGSLRATGSLYLVNPQGVVIGSSGVVVTGGRFVASSLDIANDAFMAGGTLVFRGSTEHAEVRNLGSISSTGGDVILISRSVRNEGTITAPRGTAALTAGTEVLLREGPEGHRGMVRVSGASGDVTNTGRIEAAQAELRAAGGNIYALAGNTGGVIRATGTETRQGRVWLSAGAGTGGGNVVHEGRIEARNADGTGGKVAVRAGNAVLNTGTIAADGSSGGAVRVRAARVLQQGTISARGTSGAGGTVHLLGEHIVLTGAEIDVSGATGGGVVRIGGGYRGGEGLPRASTVVADAATTIRADATRRGNGGDVVVWSDNRTDFAGRINARGGAEGGDGGQAEVSSRGVLAYTGTTDLRAPLGAWGTLLLDPYNITISTETQTTGGPPGFTPNANDSVINATVLLNALATANVIVSTGLAGSPGSQAGNITVTAPLGWTSSTTLTLQANSAINLNAVITAPAGGLTLDAGGTIGATGAIVVGRFTLTNGQWAQTSATLPAFTAGDFQLGSGTRGNGTSFLRATGGNGSTIGTPWVLTDIYGVQGMATLLNGHFKLTNDIDAAGTANWNAGAGFSPIGTSTTPFIGSLDGGGHVINGLIINRPTQDDVGLFGISGSGSTITRIGLAGGSVRGRDDVGGLVGQNIGTITQAYATGTVSGESNAGGLVGQNSGTITQTYATGAVSGASNAGGLVGQNSGTITQAYATGAVPSGGGGLVGRNSGTITASVWDTETTGRSLAAGAGSTTGTTGLSTTQARGQGGYTGWNFTADWFQAGDMRPIGRWEAAQPGTGDVRVIRNLNQLQLMAANLGASYRLGNDINAAPTNAAANSPGIWGVGGFVPVGTSATPFTGSLDGDGHVITGLTINRPTASHVGLFGLAGGSSGVVTIQNLGLVGGSVVGGSFVGPLAGTFVLGTIKRAFATSQVSANSTFSQAGGLVGALSDALLEDVYATGNVAGYNVGGLAGLQVRGTIRRAYATGAVTGSGFGVGGLVGGARLGNSRSGASGTIEQAYALGAVTATNTTGTLASAGGLIGMIEPDVGDPTVESFTNPARITQVYATGRVTMASDPHPDFHRGAGGLVGEIKNSHSVVFSSSFWDRETSGREAAIGSSIVPGIDEPKNFSILGATTPLTTAQARVQASYTGWDFARDWFQAQDMRPILRRELPDPVNGVATIRNVNQLQLMATDLGGSYRLRNDINAAATKAVATSPGIWGAGGFVPVGTDAARFTGSLDGAGRVINGLTINRPTQDYVGLFGVTGTGSTISNTGLVGGSVTGRDGVGGLVGQNSGTIMWAYATSPVTGRGSVGGLAGINSYMISQTYAAATVTGTGDKVGGLVGQNSGEITDAYAAGAVNGTTDVGGLVGANPESGTITRTYATGAVTGTTNVGGLVGANSGGISASLWNTDINVARPGVGSGSTTGATGRTTADMQNINTFRTIYAGWDFANVWAPPNQVGQGNLNPPNAGSAFYPELYNVSSVSAAFARDMDRTYGDANPTLVADHRGLRRGDTISTPATIITTATERSDVGTYAVTASGTAASSPQGRTYRIVHVPGTLTVTPRAVTLAGSRVYDGTTDMVASVLRVTNLVGSDELSLAGAGSVTSPNVAAGQQTLTLTGLTLGGSSASNYTLTGGSGTATITPATLIVTADDARRLQGQPNPVFTSRTTGLVAGDTPGVIRGLELVSPATAGSRPGAYPITPVGGSAANYTLVRVDGTLTVEPTVEEPRFPPPDGGPPVTGEPGIVVPLQATSTTCDAVPWILIVRCATGFTTLDPAERCCRQYEPIQ
jgi:filamentous hemagglutinin family protein